MTQPQLVRALGPIPAIAIVVGTVIGTGVFLKARAMMCNVGSPDVSLGVWIFAGVLSLAGALTYAELGAMLPRAGGEYVYMREAYGPRLAFIYGWMRFSIGIPGAQAAKAVAFAIFTDILTGGALSVRWFTVDLWGHAIPFGRMQLAAVGIVVLITAINCAAVVVSGRVASAIVALKVAIIAGIAIAAFAFAHGDFSHFTMTEESGACHGIASSARGGMIGFGAAMLGALWAYDGWNYLAAMGGEIDRPARNIPLALIGGTVGVIALYLAINTAYIYVLTPTEIANVSATSSTATEVVKQFAGSSAVGLMAAGMLISVVGSLQTGILAGARVPYAMAREGAFFSSLGELSPRTHVPVKALLVQAGWIILLAFSASFDALTDYVMFADWIFYALITASVFILRRKMPNAERPYRTLGYPVVPLLFVLTAMWLLISRVIAAPHESAIGLGLIALGAPIYSWMSSRGSRNRPQP